MAGRNAGTMFYKMKTKKDRKHSGRKTIFVSDDNYPFQETFWDDWNDYRDGFRGSKDRTLIRKSGQGYGKKKLEPEVDKSNKKLRKYAKIRKERMLREKN
ncbi:hypothetical protein KJ786_02070 [Patescibacteria group bacterium]|nr:hypothetical protein [Patescibacteria group bacterium]